MNEDARAVLAEAKTAMSQMLRDMANEKSGESQVWTGID
jgi:hypothetical protein